MRLQQLRAVVSNRTLDGSNAAVQSLPVHLTFGFWDRTRAVRVQLSEGANSLRFSRGNSTRGVAIKDFFLLPH